jgi:hypothetical protein
MPCGGIWSHCVAASGSIEDELDPSQGGCYICGRGGCCHFCDEWDCHLHARCAMKFLSDTEEGEIVIHHGHEVHLDFSLEKQKSRVPA